MPKWPYTDAKFTVTLVFIYSNLRPFCDSQINVLFSSSHQVVLKYCLKIQIYTQCNPNNNILYTYSFLKVCIFHINNFTHWYIEGLEQHLYSKHILCRGMFFRESNNIFTNWETDCFLPCISLWLEMETQECLFRLYSVCERRMPGHNRMLFKSLHKI